MLTKKFRLRKRTEFAYSFKHGRTHHGSLVNVAVFKRTDRLLRIGFSVNKKIGKAVVRNKVRRQMQAIVRENLGEIVVGHNLIFMARPGIETKDFNDIKQALLLALDKAGLICKK